MKTQLTERDSQLETLKAKAAGNEELLTEIEALKEANTNTTKEYQEKLYKQAYDFALERALIDAKAKNPASALVQGKIRYNDWCVETFREFSSYIWDKKASDHGEDRPITTHS